MILLLDTSTSECRLTLVENDTYDEYAWQANRELAKGLLEYLVMTLRASGRTLEELEGIGVCRGPGSFTGLRIGIATLNTIADDCRIPIVGAIGEGWREEAITQLRQGKNDAIVLPEYGRAARITKPRK